ncbi:MAG TPA: glycosyltransferase family 4 protein [Hanamia sp.]
MNPKKTLLLLIDELGRGGAEILFMDILPELNQKYSVIAVILSDKFETDFQRMVCDKKYSLGFNGKFSIIPCLRKLKKIIKLHNPSLIHSHLFYSSLIARLACPSNTPLIYSLHNEMSKDVFNNSRILKLLEKYTIKKNHLVIAVTDEVLIDYKNTIRKNIRSFVLKNYISADFFKTKIPAKDLNQLKEIRIVAVGNIKKQKNYIYLVKAFQYLKNYSISLDIYGIEDEDFMNLNEEINRYKLSIVFKGPSDNINEVLSNYDMYVMCSLYEGFGIAVVEAMALGLPLLLSDIPVLREVTFENALFFDINNPQSFANLIEEVLEGKYNLNKLSTEGIKIAKQNYTKEIYLKNLFTIYDDILKLPNFPST